MDARVVPPILVTGGTGTLGRHVVSGLQANGRDVRVLSRDGGRAHGGVATVAGDLATGDGVDAAVRGIATVVHCAGSQKGDEVKATHLMRAVSQAGVEHVVYISVVGADRIPVRSRADRAMFGYYGAKHAAEKVVAGAGVPWTTLRATQFHDLVLTTVRAMARLPVVPVPSGWRFQPIDTTEVAARLVELATGTPAGLVPDVGGPRAYTIADLVRGYLRARAMRRPILPLWLPGGAARAFRAGANLAPDRAVGRTTWEDFLGAHVASGDRAGAAVS